MRTIQNQIICKTCDRVVGVRCIEYADGKNEEGELVKDSVKVKDETKVLIPFETTPGIGPQCNECANHVGFKDARLFQIRGSMPGHS